MIHLVIAVQSSGKIYLLSGITPHSPSFYIGYSIQEENLCHNTAGFFFRIGLWELIHCSITLAATVKLIIMRSF